MENNALRDQLTPIQLVALLAGYLRHAVQQGYSLRPKTLALRSRTYFDGAMGLVRAVLLELQHAETDWAAWPESALVEWIAASHAFSALIESYEATQTALGSANAPHIESVPDPEWDQATFYLWLAAQPDQVPSYQPFAAIRALPAPTRDDYAALRANFSALPPLKVANDLAKLLEVSREEMDDAMRAPRYRLRTITKANGNPRVLEIPPENLRVLQRRLLHRVLDQVRPHDAAHGFVRGRSVHTHAAPHVSRALVIRLDLADFFPSISGAQIGRAHV